LTAAPSTRVKVTFITKNGYEFGVVFHVSAAVVSPTDPIVLAIVAAIKTLTASWPIRIELSVSASHAVTPTASATYVNEDKAEFVFLGDGMSQTYKVPSVDPGILEADTITIDATGGAANDFVSAVATNARTPAGNAITAPDVGYRRSARKTLKK